MKAAISTASQMYRSAQKLIILNVLPFLDYAEILR